MKRFIRAFLGKIGHIVCPYGIVRRNQERWRFLRTEWLKSDFKQVGRDVAFGRAPYLDGQKYISIGDRTVFGQNLYLTAWDTYVSVSGEQRFDPSIEIGNDCSFGAWNHITSINHIRIGDGCLTGKWVTITDNSHGSAKLEDMAVAPSRRKLTSKGPVTIGRNVWIGDKATILPGVTIGDGAIIAANAVVTRDIPAYSVAAGVPARVMKTIEKNGESH